MTDDERLSTLLSTGDIDAFRSIVDQHIGPITSYVMRMTNQPADTEDLVQETFLRLWSHRDAYDPEKSKLTTWLHRIAHNLVVDFHRKKKPETTDDLAEIPTTGPDREAETRSLEHKVAAALSSLPERQRSAIVMNHYQGISNRDTAEILGISVEALESLLARGRRSLRQALMSEREEYQA